MAVVELRVGQLSGAIPLTARSCSKRLGSGYGAACAGPAAIISALAGHPEGQAALADRAGVQEPTFNDLSDLLGIHLFPAMIWLCAGLVATTGDTNIAWLRQFRLAG